MKRKKGGGGKVFLSLFPREESTEGRCSRGENVKEDSFLVQRELFPPISRSSLDFRELVTFRRN